MRCKIGIVCIGRLSRALAKEIQNLNLDADFVFSETLMRDGLTLPPEVADADLLISSGYNAKILRTITTHPIITIEPSLHDILSAYSEAVAFDPKPVIILPLKQYISIVNRIQRILAVDIQSDYYENINTLGAMIAKYKDADCHCIVGSGLVCDEAERAGLHGVFVYPQESLRTYVEMAYESANALSTRRAENQLMSLVINHSRSGILFTDGDGCISLCNTVAQSIFRRGTDGISNRHITDFIDSDIIRTLYSCHTPVTNLIWNVSEEQYVISGTPIFSSGDLAHVMITMENAKFIQKQEHYIRSAAAEKGFVANYLFTDIESYNTAFYALMQTARKFARCDENVLILGETGSGKEVLAQSLHNHSIRVDQPFVAVNCSAISENLMESELFGYDEGAFTGAKKGGKQGYFEMAHNGTIFLDEISELSLPLQSKLLRVLQEKQVVHIGGNKVIHFDVRIIAATNRDLWKQVQREQFRKDLYYRLAVLELNLPPLRDREEDILPLFISFLKKQSPALAVLVEGYDDHLRQLLQTYSWPGNIRELKNFVRIISVVAEPSSGSKAFFHNLSHEIQRRRVRMSEDAFPSRNASSSYSPTPVSPEQERIHHALMEAEGNYTRASALLGISRTTLWRRLKQMSCVTENADR